MKKGILVLFVFLFLSALSFATESVVLVKNMAELKSALSNAGSGTTIKIKKGVYKTGTTIEVKNKSSLKIIGYGWAKIVCTRSDIPILKFTECGNITIKNLEVTHRPKTNYNCTPDANNIELNKCMNINIQSCELDGTGTVGVYAKDTTGIVVSGCNIYKNTIAGIYLTGCRDTKILKNYIHDNNYSFFGGIYIEESQNVLIKNNLLMRDQVYTQKSSNIRIVYNTCMGSHVCVTLSQSDTITLNNNRIIGRFGAGPVLDPTNGTVIGEQFSIGTAINIENSSNNIAIKNNLIIGKLKNDGNSTSMSNNRRSFNEAASKALVKYAKANLFKQVVKAVNDGADVDYLYKGVTPLVWAVYKGNFRMFKYLIQCGAYINKRDKDRDTPLIVASLFGRYDMARYLIMLGAELDAVNKTGNSALSYAKKKGHTRVVKLLLKYIKMKAAERL